VGLARSYGRLRRLLRQVEIPGVVPGREVALRLLVGDAAVPHCHEVALVRTQPRVVSFPVLNGLDVALQHLVAHVTVLVGLVVRDGAALRDLEDDRPWPLPLDELSEYEKLRKALIDANQEFLRGLGLA
jgi:hypothetical protein